MKNSNKNKKGFSLLELMTVTGMLAILIAVALNFIGSNKSQVELESAANEIVAALREAQNYSLTGKKVNDDCTIYTFETVNGTNRYSITGYYNDSSGSLQPCGFNMTYSLTTNIMFNGQNNISFTAPHGDTGNIVIPLSKNGNNYYVCVNSGGLITKGSNNGCN